MSEKVKRPNGWMIGRHWICARSMCRSDVGLDDSAARRFEHPDEETGFYEIVFGDRGSEPLTCPSHEELVELALRLVNYNVAVREALYEDEKVVTADFGWVQKRGLEGSGLMAAVELFLSRDDDVMSALELYDVFDENERELIEDALEATWASASDNDKRCYRLSRAILAAVRETDPELAEALDAVPELQRVDSIRLGVNFYGQLEMFDPMLVEGLNFGWTVIKEKETK